MNKVHEFLSFLESIEDSSPDLICSIMEATDAIFEGLAEEIEKANVYYTLHRLLKDTQAGKLNWEKYESPRGTKLFAIKNQSEVSLVSFNSELKYENEKMYIRDKNGKIHMVYDARGKLANDPFRKLWTAAEKSIELEETPIDDQVIAV